MHCLHGGYNLHRFSDALGLVTPVSHGADFPRLWGTGISDTIFLFTKKRLLRITLSIII